MNDASGVEKGNLHHEKPDILRGYADLLGGVSTLIDSIKSAEHLTPESRSDVFTFPVLDPEDTSIPARVWDQIGSISHFSISFERGSYEASIDDEFASISVDIYAGDTVYHSSRDNLEAPINPQDAIYSKSDPTVITEVPQLTNAELNKLMLSVLFPDAAKDELFTHSAADLTMVNTRTIEEMMSALTANGIHDRHVTTYDFRASNTSVSYSEEMEKPTFFSMHYTSADGRDAIASYSMNQELSIGFETRELLPNGEVFGGLDTGHIALQPTVEDITYAHTLIEEEIALLQKGTQVESADALAEISYEQELPDVHRFSQNSTRAILEQLDFETPPEGDEMVDE